MRFSLSLLLILFVLFSTSAFTVLPSGQPQPETQENDWRPGVLLVGYRSLAVPQVMALPQTAVASRSPELAKLNVMRVEVPPGEEERIRAELLTDPNVEYVEMDYRVQVALTPNDPLWGDQYGPPNVRAPQAWDVTTGSSDVLIAILDSGLDTGHPEFQGRLVNGYDFVDGDSNPQDACGHGTHVTGIAAATGNNNRGVAGVDWNAKIMPLRVLDRTCEGWISDVAAALVYAADHGAEVANLSLGTSAPSTLLENGSYYAYQHGVAVIAAAGNAGMDSLFYPARYPWVMAVGAVSSANLRASFSNRSSAPADLMVMAPGVRILSTTPRGSFYYESLYDADRTYGYISGTSMASPFVAGAAALLASQPGFDHPDYIYQALYHTTLDLDAAGWDSNTGYGLIQIDAALAYVDFSPPGGPPEIAVEYDMINSDDCSNLAYAWVDATEGGTVLPVFGTDGWARVALPFSFPFGGGSYAEVAVSANGFISFQMPSGTRTERDNFLIPGIAAPNDFIAPFWDDINPSAGGLVYARDLGSRFVIEWWQVPRQGYTPPQSMLTFQVILSRDSGEILFQYQTLRGPYSDGSSATAGVEFAGGQAGTQYSYNRAGEIHEGLAVLFVPAEPGTTRTVRNCLFVSQLEFLGCNQLPESFGVEILEGSIPPPPPPVTLTIRLIRGFRPLPSQFVSLNRFADITLDPAPPVPYARSPRVCYTYNAEDILKSGGHPENMFIGYYDTANHAWQRLPTQVDQQTGVLSAFAPHFTMFGVFSTRPETLPVTGGSLAQAGMLPAAALALMAVAGYMAVRRSR